MTRIQQLTCGVAPDHSIDSDLDESDDDAVGREIVVQDVPGESMRKLVFTSEVEDNKYVHVATTFFRVRSCSEHGRHSSKKRRSKSR